MVSGATSGSSFLHDIEMRIESRCLKHLGKGKLHLVGQRRQMRCGNLMILVLDQVQMLDQQVAAARTVTEQRLDFLCSYRVNLTPLWRRFRPFPSLAGMLKGTDFVDVITHRKVTRSINRDGPKPDRYINN